MSKKTQTVTVNDVRVTCQTIGDKLNDNYEKTGDLKSAQGAIQAYSTAIKAAQAQLVYKKLTGSPGKIAFFENEK